jgi:uncharacterized protein (TIGR00369 family)
MTKTEIAKPYPTEVCFGCGRDNPHGLQLRFFLDEERREVSTDYVPERRFAGQGDILHGAIQVGILDELTGWTTVVMTGEMAVTTAMNVRFLRPVYIDGRPVHATCRVLAVSGADVELAAELADDDGAVCTTAQTTYRLISADRFAALISRHERATSPTAPAPRGDGASGSRR